MIGFPLQVEDVVGEHLDFGAGDLDQGITHDGGAGVNAQDELIM